jgi:hypothetical protein
MARVPKMWFFSKIMTQSTHAKKPKDSNLEVMEWPAQHTDLNPIEHLWFHLKKKLGEYENPPKGITELRERVEMEWNNIPASVCQNLIESMHRRVAAVLAAKRGYTKY